MNIWIGFEIFINLFQGGIMIYFINRVTHAYPHSLWVDMLSTLIITLSLSLYLFVSIPVIDTVIFLLPFIHSCFVSKQKWYIRFFWTCIMAVIFIGSINVVCSICLQLMDISWDVIMTENGYRLAYLVIGNLTILVVLLTISKIGDQKSRISWGGFFLFILLIAILLFITELLFLENIEKSAPDIKYMIVNLSLFFAAMISLCLYEHLTRASDRRIQMEAELRNIKSFQEHQKELVNMYSCMLKQQHDLRHRIQVIEEMANQHSSVNSFFMHIDQIKRNQNDRYQVMTGKLSVDALLTAKKATMNMEKIAFEFSSYPLGYLPIDEMEFCVLLGNMLDNAIEAVQKIPLENSSRKIWFSIMKSQDMLFIICKNNYLSSSLKAEGIHLRSSKEQHMAHGYGIDSMRATCTAAGGFLSLKYDNEIFSVKAALPFQTDLCESNNEHVYE